MSEMQEKINAAKPGTQVVIDGGEHHGDLVIPDGVWVIGENCPRVYGHLRWVGRNSMARGFIVYGDQHGNGLTLG